MGLDTGLDSGPDVGAGSSLFARCGGTPVLGEYTCGFRPLLPCPFGGFPTDLLGHSRQCLRACPCTHWRSGHWLFCIMLFHAMHNHIHHTYIKPAAHKQHTSSTQAAHKQHTSNTQATHHGRWHSFASGERRMPLYQPKSSMAMAGA